MKKEIYHVSIGGTDEEESFYTSCYVHRGTRGNAQVKHYSDLTPSSLTRVFRMIQLLSERGKVKNGH